MFTQVFVRKLQLSEVQGLLSAQSALESQQPGTAACPQLPALHESVVQLSRSSQSPAPPQQFGIGARAQRLIAVLQVAVSQALLGSQSLSLSQQLGISGLSHTCVARLQTSVVHA